MLNTVVPIFSTGAGAAAAGDFESIATVTVGSGGASNVEFTSIGTDWTHLQVRAIGRTDRVEASGDYVKITFNSDTGSNYSDHALIGNGSSAGTAADANNTSMFVSRFSCSSQTASVFGGLVLDILDYKNTNKYKTLKSLAGYDNNGDGNIQFTSGNWRNTNAITSIKFVPGGGTNFAQYTTFALYGIKGVA